MQKKSIFGILTSSIALVVLNALLISSSSSPAPITFGKVLTPQVTNTLKYPLSGVDGGSFMMGATSEQGSDAEDDEKPAHRVTVGDFFIGTYPVTQKLWRDVMGSLPSDIPSNFRGDNKPVVCVSWNDCQDFITKLNRRRSEMNLAEFSSWRFRLPTEAEWEYAARGGKQSRGYKYAGSNDIERVAWYTSNSNSQIHEVGGKSPNELGIYDMSGNVWEWCSDWYDRDYYKSSPTTNPRGPSSGSDRVLRGGGWIYNAGICRVSIRNFSTPDFRLNLCGFRLVLAP